MHSKRFVDNENIIYSMIKLILFFCYLQLINSLHYPEFSEVVRLPLLIYDYNKKFTHNSIANYINSGKDEIELLNEIADYAPNGKMIAFFKNKTTDLQSGITVSDNKKRICVVFRGSESFRDWRYNLMIRKKQVSGDIYLHEGFYKHLVNDYEKITTTLKKVMKRKKGYEIIITGHSLGGALSTIYGYFLSKEISQNITIISFASPRVGNQGFKNAFNAQNNIKHYRITNKRDIVPAIPMFRYKHVGEHLHLNEKGKMERGKISTLYNSWRVSDHDIYEYYKVLHNIEN